MSRPRNATRPWPVPPDGSTLHVMSDTHFGLLTTRRKDKFGGDLLLDRMMPAVAAHLHCGDFVQAPDTTQDTEGLAWASTYLGDAPLWIDIGNHDVDGTWGGTTRTGAQAATALGMPGRDWTTDLGFARLISLGIENVSGGSPQIDAASLTYLDTQLAAAGTQPCWVTSHAPLYNTVGAGGPTTEYKSTDAGFYYPNDADIRAILADYPNAKAWISGHTHSPIEANNLISAETIGGHTVAAINASAIEYVEKVRDSNQPIHSVYVTAVDDTTIEVRFRNHGAGVWSGPDGGATKLVTVTL